MNFKMRFKINKTGCLASGELEAMDRVNGRRPTIDGFGSLGSGDDCCSDLWVIWVVTTC